MKKYVVKNGNGNYYWRHADMQSWDHTTPTILDTYDEALDKVKIGLAISKLLEEKMGLKSKEHILEVFEWKEKV
ncbi:hypothetical protein [Leuconostoc pseudomesenteroides]|uniref:hypothetical protein n=1 Tax=Leuconostoc pseudomesenteroides TaxID=33968 RepID=UPI0032E017BC